MIVHEINKERHMVEMKTPMWNLPVGQIAKWWRSAPEHGRICEAPPRQESASRATFTYQQRALPAPRKCFAFKMWSMFFVLAAE